VLAFAAQQEKCALLCGESQFVRLHAFKSLLRAGRMFAVLSAYIDDSASNDGRVLCAGGWLCHDDDWEPIEDEWESRVEMERRNSVKKGFPPISRYHAADCSSLRGEFDRSKGWDNERQRRFTKRLIETITSKRKHLIIGFALSASMDNFQIAYRNRKIAEKNVYRHLLLQFGVLVGEFMAAHCPDERVSIFYDHVLSEPARYAYLTLKDDDCPYHDLYVTMAPLTWKDAIALQPADLLAYEGQKAAHLALSIDDDKKLQAKFRKSLRAMLGGNAILKSQHYGNVFKTVLELRRKGLLIPGTSLPRQSRQALHKYQ
jgi:hypothetical protein